MQVVLVKLNLLVQILKFDLSLFKLILYLLQLFFTLSLLNHKIIKQLFLLNNFLLRALVLFCQLIFDLLFCLYFKLIEILLGLQLCIFVLQGIIFIIKTADLLIKLF